LNAPLLTFNRRGEIEEGKILVQVKASDRLHVRPQNPTFPFQIDRRDLVTWLSEPMPVILIVYQPGRDVACSERARRREAAERLCTGWASGAWFIGPDGKRLAQMPVPTDKGDSKEFVLVYDVPIEVR